MGAFRLLVIATRRRLSWQTRPLDGVARCRRSAPVVFRDHIQQRDVVGEPQTAANIVDPLARPPYPPAQVQRVRLDSPGAAPLEFATYPYRPVDTPVGNFSHAHDECVRKSCKTR